MDIFFSEENYSEMIQNLFVRFPSFQKTGASAYKPGIANMEFADQLMGHPHREYRIIHVAGTNGKGSVSNMLTSVLAASGMKVGLYTSPHILDFRERMRICQEGENGCRAELISKEEVWSFIRKWNDTFDHLDMSFFEITTMMALDWFAAREVDVVVLETGLGGRLDSTNIVTPVLSVITNIGLDHCDMLGGTLPEIAFEKAGIIKPKVPVTVGESHPETEEVFTRKVLYTNLPEPEYMGDRKKISSLLRFADKEEPSMWNRSAEILERMDLKGMYQRKNLRTAMSAYDNLETIFPQLRNLDRDVIAEALVHTAERTAFRGRWEKVSEDPYIICDIGHNAHGLSYNFSQLSEMKLKGEITDLVIVYGSVADKDVDAVLDLLPEGAYYVFTQAGGKRALKAEDIRDRYLSICEDKGRDYEAVSCAASVVEAVDMSRTIVEAILREKPGSRPLIYIGGSTYVVSEAVQNMD